MYLIGSRALKNFFTDYRECKDYDFLVSEEFSEKDKQIIRANSKEKIEFHFNKILLEYLEKGNEITPNVLYTLKASHSFWNIHWKKTMYDLKFFQSKECKIIEELFEKLYDFWCFKYKRIITNNFEKTNEEFFEDLIDRKYPHDLVHECIKYYDEPMFNKIKIDKTKALCDYNLFLNLCYEDQLKVCREEIYATALERILIPFDFKTNILVAYFMGLKLLVTKMSDGWFTKFIITHFKDLEKPDLNYKKLFLENITKYKI